MLAKIIYIFYKYLFNSENTRNIFSEKFTFYLPIDRPVT